MGSEQVRSDQCVFSLAHRTRGWFWRAVVDHGSGRNRRPARAGAFPQQRPANPAALFSRKSRTQRYPLRRLCVGHLRPGLPARTRTTAGRRLPRQPGTSSQAHGSGAGFLRTPGTSGRLPTLHRAAHGIGRIIGGFWLPFSTGTRPNGAAPDIPFCGTRCSRGGRTCSRWPARSRI